MELHYYDLLQDIAAFLKNTVMTAEKHGISRSQLIIDPGIGFGKTIGHNLQIIKGSRLF